MVLIEDFALAQEFIFRSPSTGKWNKPHWQAVAAAMAWFIRELPGSPVLMNRMYKIMTSHPDPTTAKAEAANLIRAQHGLNASILNPSTSTQVPLAAQQRLEEEDDDSELDVSQITPGQMVRDADGMDASGGMCADDAGDSADGADTSSAAGRTAPPTITPAPAAVVVVAAAAAVDAAAASAGAAAARNPPRSQNGKKPVCKYLWKRMLCRRADCEYSHPVLCAASACIPARAPNCTKFHGRYRDDKGDTDGTRMKKKKKGENKKSLYAPKRNSQEPAQGNGRRGGPPPNRTTSGRSNNRRFPSSSAHPTVTELNKSRKELADVKRELASIRKLSFGASPDAVPLTAAQPLGNTYSNVVKASVRAPLLNSFATVFATALESALGSAGLRLASA